MKTARFAQVVSKCGRPVVHDQWLRPDKDARLQKAVKENRLMTVHIHTVGAKKDHGEIGLAKGGQRVLLIFPKSLRAFEEKRIVGIDYGLLKEEPQAKRPKPKQSSPPKAEKAAPAHQPKASDSEAVLRLFHPQEGEEGEKKEAEKEEVPRAAKDEPPAKGKAARTKKPSKRPADGKHAGKQKQSASGSGAKAPGRAASVSASATTSDVRRLRTLIQKALKQLKTGKAVMAYETLEQALE